MSKLQFLKGTFESYKNISGTSNSDSIYITTGATNGDNRIYLGNKLISSNKVYSLSDLGITVTSDEINYLDNVSGNVQTQINSKAESVHTHEISDVNNLTDRLDGIDDEILENSVVTSAALNDLNDTKSDIGHGHEITDINGLQSRLDRITNAYVYKGSVASYSNLPTDNNLIGDVYNLLDCGENYAWIGGNEGEKKDGWDRLSGIFEITEIDNGTF